MTNIQDANALTKAEMAEARPSNVGLMLAAGGSRSTRVDFTPCRARPKAKDPPTKPPPTITMSVAMAVWVGFAVMGVH